MIIDNHNLVNFKTQHIIDDTHPDSEIVRYYGQDVALGKIRQGFEDLEHLGNMSIFYDDIFQYTSLGLLDLVFEIKKINSPIPINDFFNRGMQGNEFVKIICNLWGVSSEEIDVIEKKYYSEILRRSPLSKNAIPLLNLRKSIRSQTFIFRHKFKEVHNVFDTIRDQYNGADGGYVSLEFDYTDGLSENDYLAKVPKNRQERFEITVAQDLGAIMSFFDKRKINGTILSTVKHNNASDIQLFDAVNNYTVGYTVKFMEEGI